MSSQCARRVHTTALSTLCARLPPAKVPRLESVARVLVPDHEYVDYIVVILYYLFVTCIYTEYNTLFDDYLKNHATVT